MATNKTTVSVYADGDLLKALNEFKDSGEHKSLNVAIVAILREKLFGEASQGKVSGNLQSTLDIESIVNAAVESRLGAVLNQVRDFELELHSIKNNDLITQNLQANLTVAQQRIEALEATVSAKKPLLSVMREKVLAA